MALRNRIVLAVLVMGVGLSAAAAEAEPVAVVSSRSAVAALSPAQLADIYLGRSSRFPDGTPATPCDLVEGSPLRDAFYTKLTGKSAAQVKAHWAKIIFTGRGQPPRQVHDSDEAKRLVAANPGVVCYIDKTLVDRTVTVVLSP